MAGVPVHLRDEKLREVIAEKERLSCERCGLRLFSQPARRGEVVNLKHPKVCYILSPMYGAERSLTNLAVFCEECNRDFRQQGPFFDEEAYALFISSGQITTMRRKIKTMKEIQAQKGSYEADKAELEEMKREFEEGGVSEEEIAELEDEKIENVEREDG